MKFLVVASILLSSLSGNYCYRGPSERSKCRRPTYVVTKQELFPYWYHVSRSFGELKTYHAFKPSEHFRYVHVTMNIGNSPFGPMLTPEDLGITNNSDFNKWHQFAVDLHLDPEQINNNWILIIEIDDRIIEFDTGYYWKYNWPRYLKIIAEGESQWVWMGNATVCNMLENGQETLDAVPTVVSVGNNQENYSDIQMQEIQKEQEKCEEGMQGQPPTPTHGQQQLYCPQVFDGWYCWNDTSAGETAQAPCPAFITGFNKKRMAHRICNPDGTWWRHPDTNKTWSNYTPCADIDDRMEQNDIDVRLPTTLVPIHYRLMLRPFLSESFNVFGYVELEFEVKEPTDSIMLHMLDIDIVNETVKVRQKNSERTQQILNQTYDGYRQFFIVKLHHRMVIGKIYLISMDFNTTLSTKRNGFYRSSYVNQNGVRRWVASTQFQSTDARRSFPCMDEPGLKATFDIHIARHKNMTALSNMPLLFTKPIEDSEWVWDIFARSVPMSTYLVSYAVFDYHPTIIPTSEGRTRVKVWTRPWVTKKVKYAAELVPKILKFFGNYFNIPFMLSKLDLITPPEMSFSGMENWGLITFKESGLLYDEATSSAQHLQWVSYLTAHELAHQWFGNAVTFKWWTDLWLNEGFATYMAEYALSKVSPFLGTMEYFVVNRLQAAMALDSLSSSHPISVVVNNPVEINEIFDSISYNKGGSIIRMMEHFLTHDTFKKGLKDYFTEHMFKNADQNDLWRHLDAAAREIAPHRLPDGLTVKEIMDTWTLQEGFPVLTVTRSYSSSLLYANISQELFSFNKNSAKNSTKLWWIPITEISKGQTFHDEPKLTWFGKKQGQLDNMPHDDSWLIINVLQTGYYRVNYDEHNWDLISQQLQQNHKVIDVTNRAQIINDALNLARAGLLPYGTALKVTSYLRLEHHFVPWKAAVTGFTYLMDMFMHTPHYGPLKEYLLSVIKPVYDDLGLEGKPDDTPHTKMLRGMLFKLACSLDHKDCVNEAKKIYAQWIADPEGYKVPSNLGQAVFCSVMQHGDREEWESVWRKYIVTADATQRKAMRNGFGCIRETWMLQRYLSMAFDPTSGVKQQDTSLIFNAVARTSIGDLVAWNYLKNNWDHIVDYIGTTFFALTNMMKAVTKRLNTKSQLSELVTFRATNQGSLLTAKRAVDQAVEATANNVQWMEYNYKSIVTWLNERGFSSTLPTIESLKRKRTLRK